MQREQLLLERKAGLGGSDIAALLSLSSYRSALDVYYEKVEATNFDHDNKILKRGRRAEKYILEEYAERNEEILETDLPMLIDAHYPFLIGHVDAKVKDQNVIVEAKSTRFNISAWQGRIPIHYLCQIAHYAAISDAERVDLAVLFNNWEYGCFTYYRDEEFEQKIRKAAIDFWHNHVLPQIPPTPQCIDDALRQYPCNTASKKIEANDNIQTKLKELGNIANRIKDLSKREESIKLEIMNYMQDAELLNSSEGHSVIWKQSSQSRVDINKLKLEHPAIYAEYLKTSQYRPLKIITRENHSNNAII